MNKFQPFIQASTMCVLFGLTACGGGGSNNPGTGNTNGNNNGGGNTQTVVTIGGTIEGNAGSVTLSLNGVEETFTASPFKFKATVERDDHFAVLFVSTPTNQHCRLENNAGTATANVSDIRVTCADPISVLSYEDAVIAGPMNSGDFNGDGFTDLVFFSIPRQSMNWGSTTGCIALFMGTDWVASPDFTTSPHCGKSS